MTIKEYYLRWIAGLMLALVSTAALVLALAGLVQTPVERGMAIVAGIALQVCLFLFCRHKQDRPVGVLLMTVSVCATAAFMEYAWQLQRSATVQQTQASQSDDYQVQQMKQRIAELNRQIDIRLNVSDRDTSGNYRGRGLEALDTRVEEKTTERDRLLEQLKQIRVAVAVAPSGSIEAAINNTPDWMRWPVWLLLAWLLDYCAIRCFRTPQPELIIDEEEASEAPRTPPKPDPLYASQKVLDIADRVRSGAYGQKPVVKQAFKRLQEQGVLRRKGQGFELVD